MKKFISLIAVMLLILCIFPVGAFAWGEEIVAEDTAQLIDGLSKGGRYLTVKLDTDMELDTPIIMNGGNEVTLDLNGHTLSYNMDGCFFEISSGSTLHIYDNNTQYEGKIICGPDAGAMFEVYGSTLHIHGGTYESYGESIIYAAAGGSSKICDGKFENLANEEHDGYVLEIYGSDMLVRNGTFNSSLGKAVCIRGVAGYASKLTVENGVFSGYDGGLCIDNTESMIDPSCISISGGSFTKNSTMSENPCCGSLNYLYSTAVLGDNEPDDYIPEGYKAYVAEGEKILPVEVTFGFTPIATGRGQTLYASRSMSDETRASIDDLERDDITFFAMYTESDNVYIGKARYDITLGTAKNGSIKQLKESSVSPGQTVSFVAAPEEGYEVRAIQIINKRTGEEITPVLTNGAYTFTMPVSDVSISVAFKAASALGGESEELPPETIAETADGTFAGTWGVAAVLTGGLAVACRKKVKVN